MTDVVRQEFIHLGDKVSGKSFSFLSTVSADEIQAKLFKELQQCHTDYCLGGAGGLLDRHQCKFIDHKVA